MGSSVVGRGEKRNGSRAAVLQAGGYIVNAFTSQNRIERRRLAMRWTVLGSLVAFGVVACGGEKKTDVSQTGAVSTANAAPAPATATSETSNPPAVVEVKMTGNGTSIAAFDPATLTVKPGTVVRFINVSGGPHNVAFYTDSVPKGGVEALKKGMTNTMGDLVGPFLTQPNEHYDVSFAGAPAGKYRGYCMPHVALGMYITINVKP
jgi:plastocyanin